LRKFSLKTAATEWCPTHRFGDVVYQSIFEGRQDSRIGCSRRKKLTVFVPILRALSARLKVWSRRTLLSSSMDTSIKWPK
jgi:hypothetical protein